VEDICVEGKRRHLLFRDDSRLLVRPVVQLRFDAKACGRAGVADAGNRRGASSLCALFQNLSRRVLGSVSRGACAVAAFVPASWGACGRAATPIDIQQRNDANLKDGTATGR
jgi:hypothetical protein